MENRTLMIKRHSELKSIPDDSSDIYAQGVLDYYSERPKQCEKLCLADYAALYVRRKKN